MTDTSEKVSPTSKAMTLLDAPPHYNANEASAWANGYTKGFAIGSGDEGAYQREIAMLRENLAAAEQLLTERRSHETSAVAPLDPYVATCQGGAGGKCCDPDCEKCWPDPPSEKALDGQETECVLPVAQRESAEASEVVGSNPTGQNSDCKG